MTKRAAIQVWIYSLIQSAAVLAATKEAAPHPLVGVMETELQLSMEKLTTPDGVRPYFIQYTVTDEKTLNVSASLGAVIHETESHSRLLDVDVRVGSYSLDNTRQIRGAGGYDYSARVSTLPLNGDLTATRQNLWLHTDEEFKDAVRRLEQVKANLKIKVEEDDPSDDFSKEPAQVQFHPWKESASDRSHFAQRIRKLSERFRRHPLIYNSVVSVSGNDTNRILIHSEGTRLQFGKGWWRIGIQATTIADDGMELWQYTSFDAESPERLPDDDELTRAVEQVIADVEALRNAPIVDPYTGPAILMNRASGVFFHEIFGHRIEGHRQKDVEEGQTFARKVGQAVLPEFLRVFDDPSRRQFEGVDLNGHYLFDEEGVPGQPALLVEDGILRTFLLSRLPTRGFDRSNGHGRRQPGNRVVARQGNLFIESSRSVSFSELRQRLIEEARKQGKEFGLLFKDISGGFTTTQRWTPQAFKVLPILVYRVYVDGRPDELVRGVDIVGTPLTCFSKILATADDPAVFNGVCGAESGQVPVSAVSPSILVGQIEIEKKQKAQDRPPILPAPIALEGRKP